MQLEARDRAPSRPWPPKRPAANHRRTNLPPSPSRARRPRRQPSTAPGRSRRCRRDRRSRGLTTRRATGPTPRSSRLDLPIPRNSTTGRRPGPGRTRRTMPREGATSGRRRRASARTPGGTRRSRGRSRASSFDPSPSLRPPRRWARAFPPDPRTLRLGRLAPWPTAASPTHATPPTPSVPGQLFCSLPFHRSSQSAQRMLHQPHVAHVSNLRPHVHAAEPSQVPAIGASCRSFVGRAIDIRSDFLPEVW